MPLIPLGGSLSVVATVKGQTLTVASNGGTSWSATIGADPAQQYGPLPERRTFGPFEIGQSVEISAQSGPLVVEYGDASPGSFGDANFQPTAMQGGAPVADDLTTNNPLAALSARMGVVLKAADDALALSVAGKQEALQSGVNIRTVGGYSLLGAGDIPVSGGGGGASYTEVLNFAALPVSPADGTTCIVLQPQGVWLINRKPAGLYRFTAGAWVYLGEVPDGYFVDNVLRFFDNSDASKQLAFELGSITSGNVRTLTVPDKSGTIATLSDIVGGGVTVENVLTSTSTANALSAAQGKALKDTADALASTVAGKASAAHTHTTAAISDFNAAADARIGAASVNALADVTVTAPANGQVLKWNGTAWVNADDATGGVGVGANLTYTASAMGGVVASDSGTDASLPLADATNAGLMAPDQVTKLAGVAAGATANSADAALLDRANHTGTQLATTIGDLTEAVQDIVGALVVGAGGGYNDAAGTISLPSGGGGGGSVPPVEVTTSRLLTAADNGAVLYSNSATAYTLTLAAGLPAGFGLTLLQLGTGALSVAAGSASLSNATSTGGANTVSSVVQIGTDAYFGINPMSASPYVYTGVWSGLPWTGLTVGQMAHITDLPVTGGGSVWRWDGSWWRPLGGRCVLYALQADVSASAPAVATEVRLVTVTIPPKLIPPLGVLRYNIAADKFNTTTLTATFYTRMGVNNSSADGQIAQLAMATTIISAGGMYGMRRISSTQMKKLGAGQATQNSPATNTSTASRGTTATVADMDAASNYLTIGVVVGSAAGTESVTLHDFILELVA